MFQYLGDVVGGFNEATDRARQQNQHEADLQTERDTKVFDALANSDDPDIRAAAVTGLLTGNHPARAFDKFFGKVGTHPAYEQIKGLVANGHQPFVGQTEQIRREDEAKTSGGISGAIRGAEAGGAELSPEDRRRIAMGRAGAAQRTLPPQHGTIKRTDGTSVAGYFDQESHTYFDDNNQPVHDGVSFSPSGSFGSSGSANATTGWKWANMSGADFARQFPEHDAAGMVRPTDTVTIKVGPDGKPLPGAMPVLTQAPPDPIGSVVQTSSGDSYGVRSRSGTTQKVDIPGGRAATPETNAAAIRGAISEIERLIPNTPGILGQGATAQAKVKAARDKAAQSMQYESFDAMLAAVGQATRDVGGRVPPVPGGPPAAPGRGSAPPPRQQAAPPVDPNNPGGLDLFR